MSAKASLDGAKRNSNDNHEEYDDSINSEENMNPRVVLSEAKQKPSRSQASVKKRRPTIYTPEFKAEILEFVKKNKNIVAVRQFGIPESTLRDWISKVGKHDSEEAAARPEMEGNISSSGISPSAVIARMSPPVTNQEGISLIIDIPGLGQADSKHPSDYDHEELSDDKAATQPSKDSPKKVYISSFKEMVVKFGESKSWKAAGEEFAVPANTVGLWARQLGRKRPSKSKGIIIDDETKDKAVKYSLQMNSWKRAAQKFGFSPGVVALWGKKAGCKLKSKITSHADFSDEAKDEIVEYAVKENSWRQAANKFGVSEHTVASWGKKAGCKLKSKITNYAEISDEVKDEIVKYWVKESSWSRAARKFGVSKRAASFWGKKAGCNLKSKYPDGFKETVVSYGEEESWKAAAAKFGLPEGTVGKWAKRLGKEKRVKLGEEAKEEIVKYGVDHNSWKEAAVKYGVSPHTVLFWGKKAGYKLKRVGGNNNSSNLGQPLSNLSSSLDQSLPLHTDHEELEKEKRNHDVLSEDIEQAAVSVDGHGMKTSVLKFGFGNRVVFKWSKKLKVSKVDSDSKCTKFGDKVESGACIGKLMKGSSVIDDNIASVDTANSHKNEERFKCEACGKALAADETLDEHVVSVHLTIEGLCNICGEDSEDFVDHFKVHFKSCNDVVELPTLDTIKKENLDIDNQNLSDLVVKEECEEDGIENLKGKRWFFNPFYSK